jgi:hypothetical protein
MSIPSQFYGSDYVVINSGATFAIGADSILNISGGYTTYVQYYKLGFGATGAFSPVTASNPFPVTMSAGLTATISGFSGPIAVTGVAGGAVNVLGTVVVSGLTAAPVYVQTAPNCQVEVTGGRYLNKLNDSVSVFGPSGSTWIYSNLVNSSGVAIGTISNPIYANITGATINATIPALVTVTGLSGATGININDTNILLGMTGINAQVVGLRTDLQALGVGRPTTLKTGRASAGSGSAVQMDSAGYTCYAGINIRAISTNTDFVYLGNSGSLVGASGYALDPGENVFLDIQNTNTVYLISNTGTQVITYMAS